ncbi:hypothetical protein HW555_013140 [Spodoptera exigua]|uniref:Uncharacterized protein n=1 Tax=Spodoptera exigua TaxID=7107 RepID=A0A835G663_SPOEX|nr:hypothetical protein HW555_013140 [Spodoptera exigua]
MRVKNPLCRPPPPPKSDNNTTGLPTCCPIDCLGYPQKCCGCIPLLTGVIIICIMSFVWAIVELMQLKTQMDIIFHNNDDLSIYFKLFYMFLIMTYITTCGMLTIGIRSRRVQLIQIYIFMACIFNCICIATKLVTIAVQMFEGSLGEESLIIAGFAVLWHTCK